MTFNTLLERANRVILEYYLGLNPRMRKDSALEGFASDARHVTCGMSVYHSGERNKRSLNLPREIHTAVAVVNGG